MKALKAYKIEIFGLKNQDYTYHFEVKDAFFKQFEQALIEHGACKVILLLSKSDTLLKLNFSIQGEIELICDRSLEPFYFPVNTQKTLLLQFGDEEEVISDELEIIRKETQEINVAQYIYEFISLTVPMKKLHPKFVENDTDEEVIWIYSSEQNSSEQENEIADPRWEALKKLKK